MYRKNDAMMSESVLKYYDDAGTSNGTGRSEKQQRKRKGTSDRVGENNKKQRSVGRILFVFLPPRLIKVAFFSHMFASSF